MTRPATNFENEHFHPFDPSMPTWNESWFVSWLPADGELATFFRLGTLPNQGRAWLWCFVWTGREWIAFEETRLSYDHLRRENGVAYDKWGLRFAYEPTDAMRSGKLRVEGLGRVRGGDRGGTLAPVEIDVDLHAMMDAHHTGVHSDDESASAFSAARFEQSMHAVGRVCIGGENLSIDAPAHRDRSWGPRTWEYGFLLGDIQSDARQIYFAAGPEGQGGSGYVREGNSRSAIKAVEARIDYLDKEQGFGPSELELVDEDGRVHRYRLEAVSPSVTFDMSHTTEPSRHWLYWRAVARATCVDDGHELFAWFECNRIEPQSSR